MSRRRPTNRGANGNQGSHWIRPERRLAIYTRDGFACIFCGRKSKDGALLSLDHVKPRSEGGSNRNDNLVTACFECNSVDVSQIAKENYFGYLHRIRRAIRRPVDIAEGRRLLAARRSTRF